MRLFSRSTSPPSLSLSFSSPCFGICEGFLIKKSSQPKPKKKNHQQKQMKKKDASKQINSKSKCQTQCHTKIFFHDSPHSTHNTDSTHRTRSLSLLPIIPALFFFFCFFFFCFPPRVSPPFSPCLIRQRQRSALYKKRRKIPHKDQHLYNSRKSFVQNKNIINKHGKKSAKTQTHIF